MGSWTKLIFHFTSGELNHDLWKFYDFSFLGAELLPFKTAASSHLSLSLALIGRPLCSTAKWPFFHFSFFLSSERTVRWSWSPSVFPALVGGALDCTAAQEARLVFVCLQWTDPGSAVTCEHQAACLSRTLFLCEGMMWLRNSCRWTCGVEFESLQSVLRFASPVGETCPNTICTERLSKQT